MATRYWVDGNGDWSDTAHWSATSGGTGGASVPTIADDVVLDSSSFTANGQIDLDSDMYCANFSSESCTYPFVFYQPGAYAINVHGNFSSGDGGNNTIAFDDVPVIMHTTETTFTGYIGTYLSLTLIPNISVTIVGDNTTFSLITLGAGSTLNLPQDSNTAIGEIRATNATIQSSTEPTTGTIYNATLTELIVAGCTVKNIYVNGGAILYVSYGTDEGGNSNVTFVEQGTITSTLIGRELGFGGIYDILDLTVATTIMGSNTISGLKLHASTVYIFEAGKTQTIHTLISTGASGTEATLQSTVASSPFILSKANGTLRATFCGISDCTFTGGAFRVTDCVEGTGNSNVTFLTTPDYSKILATLSSGEVMVKTTDTVTQAVNGLMLATDKVKLDGLSTTGSITYYVDVGTGSDSNSGGSGDPVKTITYALSLIPKIIRHPVVIRVCAGNYEEEGMVVVSGFTGDETLKVVAWNGSSAVSAYTDATGYELSCISVTGCSVVVTISGFEFKAGSGSHSVMLYNSSGMININYCDSQVSASGWGVIGINSCASVYACRFSNKAVGIGTYSTGAIIESSTTYGTGNTQGLGAYNGGIVTKNNSTNCTGTTPEYTQMGGKIFQVDDTLVKGIAFPASQVASADANTLDDYEEGTWTPTLTGSTGSIGTYAAGTAQGNYTKIGNVVHAFFRLTLTSKGSWTANCRISLPFTTASSPRGACALVTETVTFAASKIVTGYVEGNVAYMNPILLTTNAAAVVLDMAGVAATSGFYGSVTYRV